MHFRSNILTFIFSMQKCLLKIIFGRKCFICEPIFKIFAAYFRTKLVLNIDKYLHEGDSKCDDAREICF